MTRKKDKKIGLERIEILFEEAEKTWDEEPELSKRYILLAKRIGQKTETPLPKKLQDKVCENCNQILINSKSCKIRIKKQKIQKICRECGHKNTAHLEK